MRNGDQVTTPPPLGQTETAGQKPAELELRKENGQIRQNSDGQTHGSGAGYGVGRSRKNGLIGGWVKRNMGDKSDGQAHQSGAGCGVGWSIKMD